MLSGALVSDASPGALCGRWDEPVNRGWKMQGAWSGRVWRRRCRKLGVLSRRFVWLSMIMVSLAIWALLLGFLVWWDW